jgi:hypothetical protein
MQIRPKDDLLSKIAGLCPEDLTTETLVYILKNDRYIPTQRLFYNYLFDRNDNLSTDEGHFDVDPQQRYPDSRPDIVIANADSVAIIENKFLAPYQSNQLHRYFKVLLEDKDFAEGKSKHLVLLTTRSRMRFYLQEVINDFSSKIEGINSVETLKAILQTYQVSFKVITWEQVLRLVLNDDPIISSLSSYVRENFMTEVKLMDQDISILEAKATAEAFEKIFEIVNQARERIEALGYNTKKYRMSQSWNYYGFSISLENWSMCFGYYRLLWGKRVPCTPLYMQFKGEWLPKGALTDSEMHTRLLQRFIDDEDQGYIKGYPIGIVADFDAFISEVVQDVKFVESCIGGRI